MKTEYFIYHLNERIFTQNKTHGNFTTALENIQKNIREIQKNSKSEDEKEMKNNVVSSELIKEYENMKKKNKVLRAEADIKSVNFDDNKKTVTVVLNDGMVGVSRCDNGDEYDQKVGFCIAYTNAVFGSRNHVNKIVKRYNGEEAKKKEEKKLRDEIIREIKLEQYKKKVEESNKKREQQRAELRKKIEWELKNGK